MEIKKRHPMRKKEAKKIFEVIEKELGCKIFYKKSVEIANISDYKILLIDGDVDIALWDKIPFLTLYGIKKYMPEKKYVTVDKGAVSFIINGADVMTPGIIDVDESIRKGEMTWVRNEENTPLAVGIALLDKQDMVKKRKGKAIKNMHHIGDLIWTLSTNL
jgi:PUA domain protein